MLFYILKGVGLCCQFGMNINMINLHQLLRRDNCMQICFPLLLTPLSAVIYVLYVNLYNSAKPCIIALYEDPLYIQFLVFKLTLQQPLLQKVLWICVQIADSVLCYIKTIVYNVIQHLNACLLKVYDCFGLFNFSLEQLKCIVLYQSFIWPFLFIKTTTKLQVFIFNRTKYYLTVLFHHLTGSVT